MEEIYDCGAGHPRYERLMNRARKVNKSRDCDDHKTGFAAPSDCDLPSHLRNAISAITAGLQGGDWNCIAEGLDMLQLAELRSRSGSKTED